MHLLLNRVKTQPVNAEEFKSAFLPLGPMLYRIAYRMLGAEEDAPPTACSERRRTPGTQCRSSM